METLILNFEFLSIVGPVDLRKQDSSCITWKILALCRL